VKTRIFSHVLQRSEAVCAKRRADEYLVRGSGGKDSAAIIQIAHAVAGAPQPAFACMRGFLHSREVGDSLIRRSRVAASRAAALRFAVLSARVIGFARAGNCLAAVKTLSRSRRAFAVAGSCSMPFFHDADLARLTGEAEPVDAVLDLVDLDRGAALLAVEEMLSRAREGAPRRIAVRFAPAVPGGGETLFLPLGRRLLEARRQGRIERFAPLAGGDGFICRLAGAPPRA
jgi:hypothetical protein